MINLIFAEKFEFSKLLEDQKKFIREKAMRIMNANTLDGKPPALDLQQKNLIIKTVLIFLEINKRYI